MDYPLKSMTIADRVTFHSVIDSRFKTNRISVCFIVPMQEKNVTVHALLPQVLKKGFKDCPSFTELSRRLENLYGAYVEADAQKRGDYQILSLSITGIDDRFALKQEPITEKLAEILCGLIWNPLLENDGFSEKYVELEKHALIDYIEAEINEKRSYAIGQLIRTMCAGEPYGIPSYGFKEKVKEITPQSAKQAYDSLLESAQIEILFTGCGSADRALAVFRSALEGQKRSRQDLIPITPHPALEKDVQEKTEQMSVSQSKLVLGFSCGISGSDPEIPAVRMMAAILGGTTSSKLFVNVREKLSLCYYCISRYDLYKGILLIDSGVENINIEKARAEILAQLEAICKGDFTEEEQRSALLSLKNSYNSVYESDSSIEGYYFGQILKKTRFTPEMEKEKLEKVTREEIIQVAKKIKLDTVYLLTGKEGA